MQLLPGDVFATKERAKEVLRIYALDSGYDFDICEDTEKNYVLKCRTRRTTGCSAMVKIAYRKREGQFGVKKTALTHICGRPKHEKIAANAHVLYAHFKEHLHAPERDVFETMLDIYVKCGVRLSFETVAQLRGCAFPGQPGSALEEFGMLFKKHNRRSVVAVDAAHGLLLVLFGPGIEKLHTHRKILELKRADYEHIETWNTVFVGGYDAKDDNYIVGFCMCEHVPGPFEQCEYIVHGLRETTDVDDILFVFDYEPGISALLERLRLRKYFIKTAGLAHQINTHIPRFCSNDLVDEICNATTRHDAEVRLGMLIDRVCSHAADDAEVKFAAALARDLRSVDLNYWIRGTTDLKTFDVEMTEDWRARFVPGETFVHTMIDSAIRITEMALVDYHWRLGEARAAQGAETCAPAKLVERYKKYTKIVSSWMSARQSGDSCFVVVDNRHREYCVSLEEKKCSCNTFNRVLAPCIHAVKVCRTLGLSEMNYCDKSYLETPPTEVDLQLPCYPIQKYSNSVSIAKRGPGRPKKESVCEFYSAHAQEYVCAQEDAGGCRRTDKENTGNKNRYRK